MTGMGRTQTLSTHRLRRTARKRERELQRVLDERDERFLRPGGDVVVSFAAAFSDLAIHGLPRWAHGVRVERAGPLQFDVVATEKRGH